MSSNTLDFASLRAGALSILDLINSKLDSKRIRVVLGSIGICYVSMRTLNWIYRRYHDPVKYVTLGRVLSSRKKYDFIVVGAGTAGSALAGSIARDNRRPKVLLIEAGDKDTYHPMSNDVIPAAALENQHTSKDWDYRTVPQQKGCDALKSKQSYRPRGKVCGGTSILNFMMWVRGHPEDYNEWEEKYECKGWSWKEIVPIFKSLEKCIFSPKQAADRAVRGFDGFQKISKKSDDEKSVFGRLLVRAAQEAGFEFNDDYNGVSQDGVSYSQYNIDENGRRLTSFRAFVATLFSDSKRKYDIDILPNAQVTKILSKDDGTSNLKVAYGVQINGDKSQNIYVDERNNGEIAISGGAINSPQILMLSGIGDPKELQQHGIDVTSPVPGVGKNLQDHICQMFPITFDAETRNAEGILYEKGFWGSMNAMKDYLVYGKGMLTSMGTEATLFLKSAVAKRDGLKSNDLQFIQLQLGGAMTPEGDEHLQSTHFNWDLNVANPVRWPLKNKGLTDDHRRKHINGMTLLNKPKSVGTVTLKSADPFEAPLVDPNYLSHPDDLEAFLEGWKILTDIYEQEAMKAAGAEVMEWEKFKSHEEAGKYMISNNLLVAYHPVGTCKMGNLKKDKMAVCSERLRVRGFKNLRVADASVAPNHMSGNPQAMCTLVGCKAAKMMMEDWQSM